MKLTSVIVLSTILFASETHAQANKRHRRSGRLIVKMKDGQRMGLKKTTDSFDDLSKKLGLKKRRHNEKSGLIEADHEMAGKMTEEQMAAELMATGEVEFAEPDYLFEEAGLPDDPNYASQWMHSVMKTPEAWTHTLGDPGIIAAVCDSGVDATHPDLQGRVITGYNPVTGSSVTTPHTTHGTKVAGLIAAAGNNGIGIAGMAWKTRIMPIRITQSSAGSAYLSDMAKCIEWAADNGAKVINLSFTGFASSTIDKAAQYARSKGALLFMAAGNQGSNVSSSPDYKSFLLVGATTSTDARASYSNYGTPVDIVAPGHQVMSTNVGGGYATINGTSFSSPVAAGLGALVWSINPDFTPDQIETIITTTTDNVGAAATFGHGRINAARAIASAMELANYDKLPTAVITLPSGRLTIAQPVTFSAEQSSDDHGITKYQWEFQDGAIAEGSSVSRKYEKAGAYSVKLTVWDTTGQVSSQERSFQVYEAASLMMSVKEIKMTVFFTKSYSRTESKVTVVSEEGKLVPNAAVTVNLNGEKIIATTNSVGVASIKGGKFSKKYIHKLSVMGISATDYEYAPEANTETTDSIQVR